MSHFRQNLFLRTIQSIVYLHQNGNLSFQKHKHLQASQPIPILHMFHGYVRKSKMLKAFLMMTGNGAVPIFLKNYLQEKKFPLQQFTLAKTQIIMKKHGLYLKSPEKHVHTHIPQNVTTTYAITPEENPTSFSPQAAEQSA